MADPIHAKFGQTQNLGWLDCLQEKPHTTMGHFFGVALIGEHHVMTAEQGVPRSLKKIILISTVDVNGDPIITKNDGEQFLDIENID